MLAVWSYWSKPSLAGHGDNWHSRRHALCSWVLSVELARRHFPRTRLLTDSVGARLLIDGLQLPVQEVATALDYLDETDARWWSLGKLHAYRTQDEPFVHIDADVYLWDPLPAKLMQAPLLAQNPESFVAGESPFYRIAEFENALLDDHAGWLPRAWQWQRAAHGRQQEAVNCGIFGGHALNFIRHYTALALRILVHPDNRRVLAGIEHKREHTLLVEQYLLAACVRYAQAHPGSVHLPPGLESELALAYLFPSMEAAFSGGDQQGYTHLIADAKRNPEVMKRLEQRVQRDYPDAYDRICRLTPSG